MKLNWGTGIFIVIVAFMAFIIVFMVQAAGIRVPTTTSNTYEQSLQYDGVYEAQRRALNLQGKVALRAQGNGAVQLCLPHGQQSVSGTLNMQELSSRGDWKPYPFTTDSTGCATLPVANVAGHGWLVRVEWNNGGQAYQHETTVHF